MSFRYVASGFRQDLEELFNRLITPDDNEEMSSSETPKQISLRFTRFCGIWRQMNFSLVFRHRHNENDLREFVDEIYLLVLPFVGSEYPLERRVFALYLLYSLFVKQPKSISQKLRINFSYLQQIRELIQICKQLEQLDVVFVWYKLWSLGAIDVVLVRKRLESNKNNEKKYFPILITKTTNDLLIFCQNNKQNFYFILDKNEAYGTS